MVLGQGPKTGFPLEGAKADAEFRWNGIPQSYHSRKEELSFFLVLKCCFQKNKSRNLVWPQENTKFRQIRYSGHLTSNLQNLIRMVLSFSQCSWRCWTEQYLRYWTHALRPASPLATSHLKTSALRFKCSYCEVLTGNNNRYTSKFSKLR